MDQTIWVKEAIEGNSQAIEAIYVRYSPLMKKVSIQIVQDSDLADDLVHDAFILALTSLPQLRNPEKLGEWLTTIVRNVSLKYVAHPQTLSISSVSDETSALSSEDYSPDTFLSEKEIIQLVNQLPAGYRQIFQLAVIQGFTHREIAQLLHIQPHSVSSQLSRAKRLIRSMLLLLLVFLNVPICRLWFHPTLPIRENRKWAGRLHPTVPPAPSETSPSSNLSNHATGVSLPDSDPIPQPSPAEAPTFNLQEPVQLPLLSYNSTPPVPRPRPFHPTLPAINFSAVPRTVPPFGRHELRSWHMTGSGSSSPSLLQQMAHTLLAYTAGQTPAVPAVIHTWEEYTHHLESTVHDQMSADSLMLLHIAQNNHGQIIQKARHHRPLTFRLSASRQLTGKWALNFGLQYTLLKSDFDLGSQQGENGKDSCYIRTRQVIHYIGLPLGVSYRFFRRRSFSAYTSAEAVLHIPVCSKLKEQYIIEPYYEKTLSTRRFSPRPQWALGLSVGMQYQLNPHWSLYAEPSLKWYIPNGSQHPTSWNANPYVFTVPFGIRFNW